MFNVISAHEYYTNKVDTSESVGETRADPPSVASVKTEAKAIHEIPGEKGSNRALFRHGVYQGTSIPQYFKSIDASSLKLKIDYKTSRDLLRTLHVQPAVTEPPSDEEGPTDVSPLDLSRMLRVQPAATEPPSEEKGPADVSLKDLGSIAAALYDMLDNAESIPKLISGGKSVFDGLKQLSTDKNSYGVEKNTLDVVADLLNLAKGGCKILESSAFVPVRTVGEFTKKVVSVPLAGAHVAQVFQDETRKEKRGLSDYAIYHDPIGGIMEYYNGSLEPPLTKRDNEITLSQRGHHFQVMSNLGEFVPAFKVVDHLYSFHQFTQAVVDLKHKREPPPPQ